MVESAMVELQLVVRVKGLKTVCLNFKCNALTKHWREVLKNQHQRECQSVSPNSCLLLNGFMYTGHKSCICNENTSCTRNHYLPVNKFNLLSKHCVFHVKMRLFAIADEKLCAICILSAICHWYCSSCIMLVGTDKITKDWAN